MGAFSHDQVRLSFPPGGAAPPREADLRWSGRLSLGARAIPHAKRPAPPDLRHAVGPGAPERAPLPGNRGVESHARATGCRTTHGAGRHGPHEAVLFPAPGRAARLLWE